MIPGRGRSGPRPGVAPAAYERRLDGAAGLRTLLEGVFRARETGLDRTVHLGPAGG
jgi:hypothetical protein